MNEHISRLSNLLKISPLNARYQYRPLRQGEIRLCQLQSGKSNDGILHLEIKHSKLLWLKDKSEVPVYTAISYTWGEETPLHTILVDGALFNIRSNLHSFLKIIASTERASDHWFWIDQISINQADTRERNSQVQLMGSIYNMADNVHVWLGVGDEVIRLAIAALLSLVGDHETYSLQRIAMQQIPWQRGLDLDRQHKERGRSVFARDAGWTEAVRDLLDRPYWSRQWIIQEVYFARELIIQCGPHTLREEDCLTRTNVTVAGKVQPIHRNTMFVSGLEHAIDCWALHTGVDAGRARSLFSRARLARLQEAPYVPLYQALSASTGECADLRDHVFAMNALVHPKQRVLVDYTISTAELYWTTINYLLKDGLWPGLDVMIVPVLTNLHSAMHISQDEIDLAIVHDQLKAIYEVKGWQWPPAESLEDPRWESLVKQGKIDPVYDFESDDQ